MTVEYMCEMESSDKEKFRTLSEKYKEIQLFSNENRIVLYERMILTDSPYSRTDRKLMEIDHLYYMPKT